MRVKAVPLLYYSIRELIDGTIQGTSADHLVNLGHIFAENLVSFKRKAVTGTYAKESVGILLTHIFRHQGIHLDQTTVKCDMYIMDDTHLRACSGRRMVVSGSLLMR